ncbi:MAG: hypothetical protein JNM13_15420 [Hyphomicrobiaceae bacterium]|nr:hypothetical protein [Hyphomicrobiaceae bacterium]
MSGRFALVVAACFVTGLVLGYGLVSPVGALRLPIELRGTGQDFAVPERAPYVPFPDQVGPALMAPEHDDSAGAPPSSWDGYAPEDESRVG